MITGTRIANNPPSVVREKLKTILAGANCEIIDDDVGAIRFRHGTYLTSTAPLLPKQGVVKFRADGKSTRMDYELRIYGFERVWIIFIAIVFFWMIFPPIIAYRSLVHHPKRFIENILAGV